MCMEELSNDAVITRGICFPSTNDIINDIAAIVQDTGISNVYIGSDVEPPLKDIREGLGDNVSVIIHHSNTITCIYVLYVGSSPLHESTWSSVGRSHV